jgi:hypothetical protein
VLDTYRLFRKLVIFSVVALALGAASPALARRGADDYYPHRSSRSHHGYQYHHNSSSVMYFGHLLDGHWQVYTRVDLGNLPPGQRPPAGGYYAVPVGRHHRGDDDHYRYDDRRGRGRDDRYDDRGGRGRRGRGRR